MNVVVASSVCVFKMRLDPWLLNFKPVQYKKMCLKHSFRVFARHHPHKIENSSYPIVYLGGQVINTKRDVCWRILARTDQKETIAGQNGFFNMLLKEQQPGRNGLAVIPVLSLVAQGPPCIVSSNFAFHSFSIPRT